MALPCALRIFEPRDQPFVHVKQAHFWSPGRTRAKAAGKSMPTSVHMCSFQGYLSSVPNQKGQASAKSRTTRSLPCPLCPPRPLPRLSSFHLPSPHKHTLLTNVVKLPCHFHLIMVMTQRRGAALTGENPI